MKLKRCDNFNLDFQALVTQLDAELALRDGDDHAFYHQFNGINQLKRVVVAYDDKGRPMACGAFKKRSATQVEIKRMFTTNTARKKGHAKLVLTELERWAAVLNYAVAVLETGKAQTEALSFYPKNGYSITSMKLMPIVNKRITAPSTIHNRERKYSRWVKWRSFFSVLR
ncbi:GNAT family N-acetyltransferase [Flavobacteriaceae bacterium]|nr:GNAT family N-acetyltransferase [Flavobacteriaceae bacterium]